YSRTFPGAEPEHHFRKFRQIGGGGEKPSVAGNAAHETSGFIMDDAAERRSTWRDRLSRRNPATQGGWREEHGLGHSKETEHLCLCVFGQRLMTGPAYDFAEQDVIDVAVDE